MKNLKTLRGTLLTFTFLVLSGSSVAQKMDAKATAAAPWKVGEVIAKSADEHEIRGGDRCLINGTRGFCYYEREFLGVDQEGNYLVQDFYAPQTVQAYLKEAGDKKIKRTDPFLVNRKTAADLSAFTLDAFILGAPAGTNGHMTFWRLTGHKELEGDVKKGMKQGLWSSWYENGQIQQQDNYTKGQKDGISIYKHENGQILSRVAYAKELTHGKYEEWYANGQPRSLTHYVNGKVDGVGRWWYENGVLRQEKHYRMNKEVGVWRKWSEEGKLLEEIDYDKKN